MVGVPGGVPHTFVWRAPFIVYAAHDVREMIDKSKLPVISGMRFAKSVVKCRGETVYKDGELTFDTKYNPDPAILPEIAQDSSSVRYVYGPAVAHNAYVIGNTDANFNLGFMRLGAIRPAPGNLPNTAAHRVQREAVERGFRVRQQTFVWEHQWLLDLLCERMSMSIDVQEFKGIETEAEEGHDEPHPKRELRRQAYEEAIESGMIGQRLWFRVQEVLYKAKKNELAKVNKVMRAIGDLGVSASLQAAWLTKYMKTALAHRIFSVDAIKLNTRFIKSPTFTDLSKAFERIRTATEHRGAEFIYFSDDSSFSIEANGRLHTFNLDIAKCDGSHTGAIFTALIAITPPYARDAMTRIVEQCKVPIKIKSGSGMQRLRLTPIEATLYSGWGGTTIINNLACLFISVGIMETVAVQKPVTDADVERCIVAGASLAGYELTVERCHIHEDLQFLKHSPVRDVQGEYVPILNPGVLLRSIGVSKVSLQGKTDEETHANAVAYTGGLLQGMYPRVRNRWIDAMKAAYPIGGTSVKMQRKIESATAELTAYKVVDGEVTVEVSDAALFRRYRLEENEIEQLYDLTAGVGYHHHSSALAKILAKDYGLGMIDELFPGSVSR
jgi:hypothetical protein